MRKTEQKTRINYENIEGEKENRNKYASYHYSSNEYVPQKKYSVNVPAENPYRVGVRSYGKNGDLQRVKGLNSVYKM